MIESTAFDAFMMPSPLPNVFANSWLSAALLEMEGYDS
jgi:hypothetical protein